MATLLCGGAAIDFGAQPKCGGLPEASPGKDLRAVGCGAEVTCADAGRS